MNEPVKVLYFVDRMLRGGIQSLVIDWVSRFDKNKIQVDFLLLDDGNNYELEDTLKELGCKVFKLEGVWFRSPIDFIKESKALNLFFKEHHDYKVVHLHSSSKNFLVLKYSSKYGIPIRISHSHTIDFQTKSRFKKFIGNILKKPLIKYSTNYFACSILAGKFLFGDDIIKNPKFKVIHNAVNYDKFKYNKFTRKKLRKELNIADTDIVIGHIGRFEYQKNHDFLVDVFYKIIKLNNNYKLLLVGTGSLENSIKEKVKNLGIENNVIFAGYRNDVYNFVQAMDVFAFPSRYEGLGLGLVEAQASGIPCFATKGTIPEKVKINSNFKFLELKDDEWVNEILNVSTKRVECKDTLKAKGYFIDDVIDELTKVYLNGVNE